MGQHIGSFRRTRPMESLKSATVESADKTDTTPLRDFMILSVPRNSLKAWTCSWRTAITESTESQFWSCSASGCLANGISVCFSYCCKAASNSTWKQEWSVISQVAERCVCDWKGRLIYVRDMEKCWVLRVVCGGGWFKWGSVHCLIDIDTSIANTYKHGRSLPLVHNQLIGQRLMRRRAEYHVTGSSNAGWF